jgi:hypothetical protein
MKVFDPSSPSPCQKLHAKILFSREKTEKFMATPLTPY